MTDISFKEPTTSHLGAPQFAEYLRLAYTVLDGAYVPDIHERGASCMDDFLQDNPQLSINPVDVDIAFFIEAQNRINHGEHITRVYEELYGMQGVGIRDDRPAKHVHRVLEQKVRAALETVTKPSLTAKVLQGPWPSTTHSQKTT